MRWASHSPQKDQLWNFLTPPPTPRLGLWPTGIEGGWRPSSVTVPEQQDSGAASQWVRRCWEHGTPREHASSVLLPCPFPASACSWVPSSKWNLKHGVSLSHPRELLHLRRSFDWYWKTPEMSVWEWDYWVILDSVFCFSKTLYLLAFPSAAYEIPIFRHPFHTLLSTFDYRHPRRCVSLWFWSPFP